MGAVTTLAEFRTYVKTALGEPVVCVEISNSQIDNIVYDACQEFCRYMYGEGTYEDYMLLSVTSGTSAYSLSAVEDVVDLELSSVTGINTLFSNTHILLYDDFTMIGGTLGGAGGMALSEYTGAMQYLKEVQNTFSRKYRSSFRIGQNELVLMPTPTQNGTALLQVYKTESAINLYNHILVKKLVVARCKKQWGLHLKKYNMPIPGGGNINGTEIYNDGVTEEESVMNRIYTEGQPIDFFVG